MTFILSKIAEKAADFMVSQDIVKKLREIPNQLNEIGYDNWGMNPKVLAQTLSLCRWIFEKYFRVEIHGIDRVPQGRVLIISNHGGQLPWDGTFLIYAMALYANPPRILRGMVERLIPRLPFFSTWIARCGQIVGDPINCKKLLEHNEAVMVFPEGVRGSGKLFWKRYQLQRFGSGFMRLALETATPIVPVAVIGAEETYPAIYNLKTMARILKLPYCPITPTWPVLGPLGLLPIPVKIRIYFGEPMRFEGDFDAPEQDIQNKVNLVTASIQQMIQQGLKERGRKYF